ncbi:MAG: hypothetical protein HQL64_05535 [Magnetococcales bacterium]|nr:hypothetical protein [Magnetococcales bacterium]
MKRSIQCFFSVVSLSLLLMSSGACRQKSPPEIAGSQPPVAASATEAVSLDAPPDTKPETAGGQPPPVAVAAPEETPSTSQAKTAGGRSPANPLVLAAAPAETPSTTGSDNKVKKQAKSKGGPATQNEFPPQEQRVIPGDNRSKSPPLAKDGIHDPTSPAMQLLQNPAQALSAIPAGKWGEVDWMRAIREGIIKPYATLNGKGTMETLDMDIILANTKTMHHVRFPHDSHTRWLACSNCHPDIFVPKKGANAISMDSIFRGRYCGTCHGRVAFSVYICQRCHSVPHENSPPQWW